jgi:hypothetical protein
MTGFYIVGGLICAVIAAPIYSFIMLWLAGWQRFFVALLIGMLLLISSAGLLETHQLGLLSPDYVLGRLLADLRVPLFLALSIGWVICGFAHAIVALCRGWRSRPPLDTTPEPARD